MSSSHDSLHTLDYSFVQQCTHCGFCLPTCPTFDATHLERNSPRGRIALMRAIADGRMDVTRNFANEMYFCLGCLACMSACPAGVEYSQLFETSRAMAEQSRVLANPSRDWLRLLLLRGLFTRPTLIRFVGKMLYVYQRTGLQKFIRKKGLTKLLPPKIRSLEPQTPTVQSHFSHQLIRAIERPADGRIRFRVGMLTGCIQDLVFSNINRDTTDVLLANGCEVQTPSLQFCCGSLHAHNGELETSRELARRNIDRFDIAKLDAIITNAAGCGSHLKTYERLLAEDKDYAERAIMWTRKCKDIHEFLVEIGFRPPTSKPANLPVENLTYHEACHLCHGQKITAQPRKILSAIPGVKLTELAESTWCCGSAGIYNIIQPEMSQRLLARKLGNIARTGASIVVTANPGCHLQLENGAKIKGVEFKVMHPVSLLAAAYRAERPGAAI